MPPKAAPKKEENIDLSEIGTLPKAKTAIFQIAFSKFKTTEARTKIQEHVLGNFPEERVKKVTKQDITDYGKGKGIIVDQAPEGDSRTAEQMMAQAAADRLFELQFAVRKAKKDKQTKLEEEAAAKQAESGAATPEKIEIDYDILDALVYMPDYPVTQKEILAFSEYGHSVNCFFEIYQVQENVDGTAPVDLKAAKEVAVSEEEGELSHFNSFMEQIASIKGAIAASARSAHVRGCAIFRIPYLDLEIPEFTQNEEGERTTNILTSEQAFMKTFFNEYLEKFGAFYVNYVKFKEQVELHQLHPDKAVMAELAELKRAHTQYEQWKADREASRREAEALLTDQQKEGMSQEQLDAHESQKEESVKNLESEMDTQKQKDIENQEKVLSLLQQSKRSLDEEKDKSKFSDKTYQKDFIPDKESTNCVPSILSAMVSQIAIENGNLGETQRDDEMEASTEAETLEDVFEHYKMEINITANLEQREVEDEPYTFIPLKGQLPTDINVYETYDTSTKCIQTLPANLLEERKGHAQKIAEREKEAARNLVLPGCSRFMMPDVPSKSLRLRNYENPQFYPFSTLPVEDAERTMQLKAFQQLIKSNNIDEGVKPEKRLAKNKIFERKYDEYFESDILRQVIQDAMLQDPDISAMYYPRSDQLLLVLHNKINNSKRSSDNKEQPHGLKKWRSAYRVMPDFQTWIEFFGHNSVIQHTEYEAKDPSDPPVKFSLDEEMIPYQMLDIDDHRVTSLNQTLNQYFPDDNSIITSEEYQIGGVTRTKTIVYKDKITFGLNVLQKEGLLPQPEQHGLVSYKNIGEHQLWLNFADKESKLLVETVEAQRNPQMQIEIKPPEPTPEEIAAKEEAAKAAAEAAKKNKGKPAAVEEVEEEAPQVRWESAPPNFLDNLFKDEDFLPTKGPCSTLTLKNGLIVRHMPNGDVVQIKDTSLVNPSDDTEVDRVHLKDGIVVRHFHNLDCQVLWPNGEFASFSRADMKWTVTNDKGFRREIKDGVSTDLPKINCLIQTDQKTGIVTKVREDNVVLIIYEDGNRYCQHADGTQIFTENEGTRVEKDGFAPITYQPTEEGEDMDAWLDTEELKSTSGQMTIAYLPDGCNVKTIRFFKSSEETDRQVVRHIYQRQDYSCFMIDEDGDFRVVSSDARAAINDDDERARLGTDTDYLKVHYQPQGEQTPGVYYGTISDVYENVHIACRDCERPFAYRIKHDNKLEKTTYEAWEENTDWKEGRGYKEFDADRDIERINNQRNPYIRSFIFPRVFVINPNGEGLELLSQDQIDKLIKFSVHKDDTLTTSRVEYVDNTQMNSIQVLNKVTSIQEVQLSNQKMDKLSFPEYAWPYIIPRKTEEEIKQMKPLQDQYQYRNITEYSSFEPLKQNAFIEDYVRFNEWKQSQVRYDSEFGITHVAPRDGSLDLDEIEDNEFYARRINLKIYNERANAKEAVSRSIFKENFCKAYNTSEEIVGFRKRMTTVEKEEEEIRAQVEKRKKDDVKRQLALEQAQKEEQQAVWREKKKQKTKVKVDGRLQEYTDKKETPIFASQYKTSRQGVEYYRENPVKPPSDEVLMRMTQRITRSQQNTDKNQSMFEGQSQGSGRGGSKDNTQMNEDKDNPIVALEPEENLKQASIERSKKYTSASKHTGDEMDATGMPPGEPGPSLYQQEKGYLKQIEQEKILKAEEHHVIKTKDFDVYGKLRQDKPFVKATVKSNVPSELNERFITTECITDRRVRISSMANRQYMNAPTVEEVRKQGQHQMILQAINKKQTFSELINQANSMVTSVLHDGLKRSVNVLPSQCKFGSICQGEDAEMIITVKNEDSLSQRVQIKAVTDKRLVVKQESYGPIAPGMTKRIIVCIKATEGDSLGKIKEEIQVMTKSDVFKVPVEAVILSPEAFAKQEETALAETGKRITNSRVKNRLRSSIAQGRKNSVMATFKAQQEAEQQQNQMLNQAQQLTAKEGGDDMEGSDQQFGEDMEMN